jgi:LMBR1 domain-containing protein 1
MKANGTYMNTFLFNVTLILLASCSITQFCSDCLEDYVAFTDINMIFNVQIKYLKFFKFFYKNHIFQYILFIIFVISLVYLLIKPSDSINKVLNKSVRSSNDNSGNQLSKKNDSNTTSNINNSLPPLGLQ